MMCNQFAPDGLNIYKQWVCVDCERDIVNASVDDVHYPFLLGVMKELWLEVLS